jgi:mannose/fructose/N-acetylgalactosamine-specific phosphotransferase system component IID
MLLFGIAVEHSTDGIALGVFFFVSATIGLIIFLLKNIHYGYGDGDGIPEPVGDGDGIQFLIPVGYG